MLAGAAIDDKTLKAAGDAAAEEAEILSDVRGSAAYKRELLRVYIGRAVRAARERRQAMTAPVSGKQIGRSLPRLEARAKVSGRAEYTHIMRLPGMLHLQNFPQHGAAWAHQIHRR